MNVKTGGDNSDLLKKILINYIHIQLYKHPKYIPNTKQGNRT